MGKSLTPNALAIADLFWRYEASEDEFEGARYGTAPAPHCNQRMRAPAGFGA